MRRRPLIALVPVGVVGVAMLATAVMLPGQQADDDYIPSVPRPSFAANGPTVCIDEAHHNGHTAGGTFRPLARLLEADGYTVMRYRASFTREALADCRMVLAANAAGAARPHFYGLNLPILVEGEREDTAFAEQEIAALVEWIREGGALLLVADHFPYGSASSRLSDALGVHMSAGFTAGPNRDPSGNDAGQLVFSRSNRLLGAHPILTGRDERERVTRVVTFTGQSLAAPAGTALLRLPAGAIDHVPPPPTFRPVPAAGRSQGVALRLGRGRVVVLAEAAFITAQREGDVRYGMGARNDNAQFALNVLHWLTGAPSG